MYTRIYVFNVYTNLVFNYDFFFFEYIYVICIILRYESDFCNIYLHSYKY